VTISFTITALGVSDLLFRRPSFRNCFSSLIALIVLIVLFTNSKMCVWVCVTVFVCVWGVWLHITLHIQFQYLLEMH